jgi:hypothetical protein
VWLPTTGWNQKFQAVGNGDAAGVISYDAMVEAIRRGYATSSTDTGHVGNTMAFALGHHHKYVDFGYRSVHEMAINAKAIVEAFFVAAPVHSYWNGCSQGGRQGITEAIRYPADFDAIAAALTPVPGTALAIVRTAVLPDRMSSVYASISSPSGTSTPQPSPSMRVRRIQLICTPSPARCASTCTGASGLSAVPPGVTSSDIATGSS